MARENEFLESYKSLHETRNRLANKEVNAIKEAEAKKEQFMKNYYDIRESKEQMIRRRGVLMEQCRDNALSTVIKAIYITALEAGTLTDQGIILAENMVDQWIKENGGASKILSGCKNKTYLLNRISEIVEEAALIEAEEIENIQDDKISFEDDVESEETTEEPKETGNTEVDLALKVVANKIDTEDPEVKKALELIQKKAAETVPSDDPGVESEEDTKEKEEEPAEETESEELKEEESGEEAEESDDEDKESDDDEEDSDDDDDETDDANDILDDASGNSSEEDSNDEGEDSEEKEEKEEDSTESEEAEGSDDIEVSDEELDSDEEVIDDEEDSAETLDDSKQSDGKVFDELEKEEDVQKAVQVIRQRVADAEENFIKRNAEDKKQVEELIGKISDNVKAVEDMQDKDSAKAEVAKEHARIARQKISELSEHKSLTVLEKMTRNLNENIIRNTVVKEQYMTEEGTLDTALVVEAGKVMYGFLETLNTLQLEKVDAKYIAKVLDGMN